MRGKTGKAALNAPLCPNWQWHPGDDSRTLTHFTRKTPLTSWIRPSWGLRREPIARHGPRNENDLPVPKLRQKPPTATSATMGFVHRVNTPEGEVKEHYHRFRYTSPNERQTWQERHGGHDSRNSHVARWLELTPWH